MDTTAEILAGIAELKLKLAVKRKQQRSEKLKVERERRRVEHENYKKSAAEVKKLAKIDSVLKKKAEVEKKKAEIEKNKKSKKKNSISDSSEVWLSAQDYKLSSKSKSKSKGRKKSPLDESELDRRLMELYHPSRSDSKLIQTSSSEFDFEEECGKINKNCLPLPPSTKILHSTPKKSQKQKIKTPKCKKLNLKVDAPKRFEAKNKLKSKRIISSDSEFSDDCSILNKKSSIEEPSFYVYFDPNTSEIKSSDPDKYPIPCSNYPGLIPAKSHKLKRSLNFENTEIKSQGKTILIADDAVLINTAEVSDSNNSSGCKNDAFMGTENTLDSFPKSSDLEKNNSQSNDSQGYCYSKPTWTPQFDSLELNGLVGQSFLGGYDIYMPCEKCGQPGATCTCPWTSLEEKL
jgi:hypothetical protein